MRRLSGTICACRWWQVRVGRKLNMLDTGSRVYALEIERVVALEGARDGGPVSVS
jgi:hypothetical protein